MYIYLWKHSHNIIFLSLLIDFFVSLCSPPFLLLLLVPGICWPTFGHYTFILHFLEFYINKLTNDILLCLWFLSLSMMKNHYCMFVSGYLPWRQSDQLWSAPSQSWLPVLFEWHIWTVGLLRGMGNWICTHNLAQH